MSSAGLDRPLRVDARDGATTVVLVVHRDVEAVLGQVVGLRADLALVDCLARLALAARGLGCSIRLRDPCAELRGLLELVGMTELVAGAPRLPLEARREAEGGEQLGVEEVVQPGDPAL
jgi:hypothetical protein